MNSAPTAGTTVNTARVTAGTRDRVALRTSTAHAVANAVTAAHR